MSSSRDRKERDYIYFKDSYFYFQKMPITKGIYQCVIEGIKNTKEKGFIVNPRYKVLFRPGLFSHKIGVEILNPEIKKYLIGRDIIRYQDKYYWKTKIDLDNTKEKITTFVDFVHKVKEIEGPWFVVGAMVKTKDFWYLLPLYDGKGDESDHKGLFILPKTNPASSSAQS